VKLFFYKNGSRILVGIAGLVILLFISFLILTDSFQGNPSRETWIEASKFFMFVSLSALSLVLFYFVWRQIIREDFSAKIPVTRLRLDHLLSELRDMQKLVDLKSQIGTEYFYNRTMAFLNLYNLEREHLDKLFYRIHEEKVNDRLIQIDYELVQVFRDLGYISGSNLFLLPDVSLPGSVKESMERWLKYYNQQDLSY
jgi:hypothetical protein